MAELSSVAVVPSLFDPIRIGDVKIRNRTVLPSMTTRLAAPAGDVTAATIAYYRARAEGGTGLVTVEMASPEPAGRHRFRELGIYDDRFLPGLGRLTGAIHESGAKASIQLGHGGSRARSAVSGVTPIAPSALPISVFEIEHETVVPQEMSRARIDETVTAFVEAAERARRAGFDVVELHGAHGYLISQFLSPAENQRSDEYGGSLANRARFGLRIVREVKAMVPDLPVIFRIGVEDFFAGGLTAAEGIEVGSWAAEAGADAVSVTAGHYRSVPTAERMIPPMAYPAGTFLDYAAQVRAKAGVPVIGVGRLGDPEVASRAVADGQVDMVALGRPLIADPAWVAKAAAGAPVRRCLACNHCITSMRSGAALSCVVNPGTGRELELVPQRAPRGRRIVVLGAGPAGLSYASLVAPGNDVTLVERAPEPGGAFRLTGKAARFNDVEATEAAFAAYVAEQERACRRDGVDLRYSTELDPSSALLRDADLVVIATGARYRTGLGVLVPRLLRSRAAGWRLTRRVISSPRLRDLLYYRLRVAAGGDLMRRLRLDDPGAPEVRVIGDAARAGKAREAITSAFEEALSPHEQSSDPQPATSQPSVHSEV